MISDEYCNQTRTSGSLWWDEREVDTSAWAFVQVALFFALLAISVTGNCLLLCVLVRDKDIVGYIQLSMASLAVVDLFTALSIPYYIVQTLYRPLLMREMYGCLARHSLIASITALHIGHLLHIAICLHLTVLQPRLYRYLERLSCCMYIILLTIWTFSLAVGCIPLFIFHHWDGCGLCWAEEVWNMYYLVPYMVYFAFGAMVTLISFLAAHWGFNRTVATFHVQSQTVHMNRKSFVNLMNTLSIVALVFYVLYLPYHALSVAQFVFGYQVLPSYVQHIFFLLLMGQSAVNPWIYPLNMSVIRKDTRKEVAKCCYCCFDREEVSTDHHDRRSVQGMAIRDHSSGTMLNFHTTLGGKRVQIPNIIISPDNSDDTWGSECVQMGEFTCYRNSYNPAASSRMFDTLEVPESDL